MARRRIEARYARPSRESAAARSRGFCHAITVACFLIFAVVCAAPAAAAQTFYKSVLPDGHVVYGDEPAAHARHSERITVQIDAPSADAEAARRALEMNRQQLLRDSAARSARLAQLEAEIAAAYQQLKAAEEARDNGRGLQEGDRQGRRISAGYGERQRTLDAAVREARQRLDRLLGERSALR